MTIERSSLPVNSLLTIKKPLSEALNILLLNRIFNGLLCDIIFQLKRNYRQTIDEDGDTQRQLCIVHVVVQLADHTENIIFV